ncbi:MAG: NrsF family protein [Polyangiaceae bacterium]
MTLPASLKDRVLEAAKREPSETRAQHQTKAIRALAVGTAVALFILFVTGGPELGRRPAALLVTTALILAALATAMTVLAVRGFGKSMTGASSETLITAALISAPAMWLVELGARLVWPPTMIRHSSVQSTIICHVCTLAMALGPMIALIRIRRNSDPVHPRAFGAALGAAAGAWGAVLIDLHCASNDMQHIALGHLLPTAVLAVIGAVVGAKSLSLGAAH